MRPHRFDDDRSHLEDFLALVAHEVRTPLTVVKAAAVTLKRLGPAGDLETREDLLAVIDRNVDLAILLMGRMDLAREVERSAVTLTREHMDLVHLIHESVGDLQLAILGEHPVSVTAGPNLPVHADPTAVREIAFNVLSNAVKYSEPTAPIEVGINAVAHTAEVVVRDHGRGIPPGTADLIFDKFFQGDGDATGSGLGLFISRGLAQSHGGDLYLRTAGPTGCEFVFELPPPPADTANSPQGTSQSNGSGRR